MYESVLHGALDLPLEQKKSLIECLKGAALAQMYMSTESVAQISVDIYTSLMVF